MFKFDVRNNPKPYDLYLCKTDGSILCYLNGIDEQTASLTTNLNNKYELSFDYNKFVNVDGKQILSNGFEDFAYGMRILVNGIGFFKMDYPVAKFTGEKEVKSISAKSIDSELEDKNVTSFKVNTGESDSLEYLVTYDDSETESLINDYTGLPYDYIVFYCTYPEQLKTLLNKYQDGSVITDNPSIEEIVGFCKLIPRLRNKVLTDNDGKTSINEYVIYTYNDVGNEIISIQLSDDFNSRISYLITFYTKYREQLSLICLATEKCKPNWTIGNIDSSLANKKFRFDIDDINIYCFLTQNLAQAAKCVFEFDINSRRINATPVDLIGKNSNVVLDQKNFINTIDLSCSENGIYTRYNVSGDGDLSIRYVNFGSAIIDDLTYFLNARDENGNLVYMSEELAAKYKQFIVDRNLARQKYIEYTRGYNQSLSSIDEIKYRVPNDEVQNDWDTFTNKELDAALTSFNNLLVTLISLYKEDFGSAGCNSDGSVNESYLKNTIYWYDYYAYNIAIEQINATIEARRNNSSYAEIDDKELLAKINAWKTEWTLFGTVELQNKINAYNNNMTVLVDGQAIILKENSDEAKTWDSLSSDEKTQYGNLEINYQYDTYMQNYNERNSCQAYLSTLMEKLNSLEEEKNNYQSNRNTLVKLVSLDGYNREELNKIVSLPSASISGGFTDVDKKVINLLYVDGNYSNSNILTTSLDTAVSEIDVQYDLLKDAEEELSAACQPQITFQADIDNFLCMPEFADYDFTVGNYVAFEYSENYYVNLRLSSITFNPLVPTSQITISFTNYIKTPSKRTDLSYILNLATGSGSSSSSGSSGGGSGSFGDSDKIDVTLSNTMLAKLLNTEMFGTRVSNIILDTIQVNKITAKFATFDGLAKGKTTIDGECIKTGVIVSNNYNGTKKTLTTGATEFSLDNTVGSIFKMNDGTFNLAGGKLVYNGELLNINAHLNAVSISTGGKVKSDTQQDGLYIDNNGTLFVGATNTTQINKDGTGHIGAWYFNATQFYNQTITENSDGYIGLATADFARTINGTSRDLRFAIGSKFGVTKEGKIYATDITIDTGYIGGASGFVIAAQKLYSNFHNVYNHANDGVYIGTDYIALGSKALTWFKYDGTFSLGGGKIKYNGTKVEISSDVSLAWSQISDGVTQVTQITKDTVTTSYINALNVKAGSVDAENITGTTITGKTFSGCTGEFSGSVTTGKLTATGGKIANFTIENGYLYNGIGIGSEGSCGISCGTALNGSDNYIFWAGNGVFRVNKSGQAWLTNASVTGSITATSMTVKNSISMYRDDVTATTILSMVKNTYYPDLIVGNTSLSSVQIMNWVQADNQSHYFRIFKYNISNGETIADFSKSDIIFNVPVSVNEGIMNNNGEYKVPVGSSSSDAYYVNTLRSGTNSLTIYGSCGNSNGTQTTKSIAYSTSDARLKENIKDSQVCNALEQILKIRHRDFDWINGEHVDLGYIAQELEEINELMVLKPNDDSEFYGVNTFYLMGVITKAIQELYQIVLESKR